MLLSDESAAKPFAKLSCLPLELSVNWAVAIMRDPVFLAGGGS